jgi:hypothetical protein
VRKDPPSTRIFPTTRPTSACLWCDRPARRMYRRALTMVAEMPGYPIRKLPFGGPDTRSKSDPALALQPPSTSRSSLFPSSAARQSTLRLTPSRIVSQLGLREQGARPARRMYRRALTMVAEMPGYPIRKCERIPRPLAYSPQLDQPPHVYGATGTADSRWPPNCVEDRSVECQRVK